MKLIQSPLRYASVWLLGLAATIAGLEPFLPELAKVLPEHWYGYASVLILVARVIQQGPPKPPDGGTSAGAVALLLACLLSAPNVACTPRPAGRDVCYATADADAFRRYLDECKAYESTRDCPAAEAIEADHQKAQAVCP
jgi:hypothetical protein